MVFTYFYIDFKEDVLELYYDFKENAVNLIKKHHR